MLKLSNRNILLGIDDCLRLDKEENSMLYYVAKIGVYCHGIYGIYEDLDEAKNLADIAASQDEDDYHEWCVLEYTPPDNNTDYTKNSSHKSIYKAA